MTVNSSFLRGLQANLAYWELMTARLQDAHLEELGREHLNIIRAVKWGLLVPKTRPKAIALSLQASYFAERTGGWQDWIPILTSISQSTDLRNQHLVFQALIRQGQLLRLNRQLKEGIAVHQEARVLALCLNDTRALAEACINLSDDYHFERLHEKAEQYGLQALALLEGREDSARLQSIILLRLGLVAHECEQLEQAEQRLRQAEVIQRVLADDPVHLARILNALAVTLQAQEKLEAAISYYQQASLALEPTASALDKSKVWNSLGTLYMRLAQYNQAEAAFRQAGSPALTHSGDLATQASITSNLGLALMEQRRFDEALLYLRRSQRLWQQAGDKLWLANTLSSLAELFTEQGQLQSAIAYYDEALSLVSLFPDDARARRWQDQYMVQRQELVDRVGPKPDGRQESA